MSAPAPAAAAAVAVPAKRQKTSTTQHVKVGTTNAREDRRASASHVLAQRNAHSLMRLRSNQTEAEADTTAPAAAAASSSSSAAAAAASSSPASAAAASAAPVSRVIAQFVSNEGATAGPQIELPLEVSKEQLHLLLNKLLENEEKLPYSFFLKNSAAAGAAGAEMEQEPAEEQEILSTLAEALANTANLSTESILSIVYQPQAIFRVRAVTRCTSTIPGHTEAVLHVQFSGNGQSLATGSGDTTVRIWDVNTETPKYTLKGHKDWVLALAWSPNGRLVASGGKDNEVRLWDYATGKLVGKPLKAHTKWITALAWEPLHKNVKCTRLASSSKDGDIRVSQGVVVEMQYCVGSCCCSSLSLTPFVCFSFLLPVFSRSGMLSAVNAC